MDESGNFQKPLKISSFKQIYLQIEKTIYKTTLTFKRSHTSLSNALIIELICLTIILLILLTLDDRQTN